MSIVAWATGVFATHPRRLLQAITLRQEVRQQGNASAAPQQAAWHVRQNPASWFHPPERLHQQALGWGIAAALATSAGSIK